MFPNHKWPVRYLYSSKRTPHTRSIPAVYQHASIEKRRQQYDGSSCDPADDMPPNADAPGETAQYRTALQVVLNGVQKRGVFLEGLDILDGLCCGDYVVGMADDNSEVGALAVQLEQEGKLLPRIKRRHVAVAHRGTWDLGT